MKIMKKSTGMRRFSAIFHDVFDEFLGRNDAIWVAQGLPDAFDLRQHHLRMPL